MKRSMASSDASLPKLPMPKPPSSPTRSGPVLTLLDPVYDWGSVVAGAEIVHTFHVRNDGDAPLVIRRAKPT